MRGRRRGALEKKDIRGKARDEVFMSWRELVKVGGWMCFDERSSDQGGTVDVERGLENTYLWRFGTRVVRLVLLATGHCQSIRC